MATINQIPMTIMGNIVKDLEPKRTAGSKTVVAFRVAQTSSTERNGKWEDGETTFIRCVAYRNGREAQQLRTQRRRHRYLHPLCHGPDHQSQ